MRRFTRLALLSALILACAAPAVVADEKGGTGTSKAPNPRALIKTSKGDITVELFPDAAPETVRTFLGLAHGEGTYTDVRNATKKVTISKPFYDGLTFHRVIPGFMIQGGCPQGRGTGGPGFFFKDEIDATVLGLDKIKVWQGRGPHPWIGVRSQAEFSQKVVAPMAKKHKIDLAKLNASKAAQDELWAKIKAASLKDLYEAQGYKYTPGLRSRKPVKGSLALANSGPNTNGSQFFLNLGDTPHLTGRHTVFGQVIQGMDVLEAIGAVKTGAGNKPVEPVKILSIRRL